MHLLSVCYILVTADNYNMFTVLITLQIATAHPRFSQSAVSSRACYLVTASVLRAARLKHHGPLEGALSLVRFRDRPPPAYVTGSSLGNLTGVFGIYIPALWSTLKTVPPRLSVACSQLSRLQHSELMSARCCPSYRWMNMGSTRRPKSTDASCAHDTVIGHSCL